MLGLSDHWPVVLTVSRGVGGPKPFKWFSHWADILDLAEVIKSTTRLQGLKDVPSTLRAVKAVVKVWGEGFS
ncbi:hypothetical protein V6N12_005474 [Hibiscus sabdariffa]|uniref:Uncharacterized protein n=1 Tax=Hibiscus sabdariffa TaxID=183260 RepID=A0ABR2B862_9ROSI